MVMYRRQNFKWSDYDLLELKREYYDIWLEAFRKKYWMWYRSIYRNLWYIPREVQKVNLCKAMQKHADFQKFKAEKRKQLEWFVDKYEQKMNNLPPASEQPYYPWAKQFIKLPLTVWRLS